VGPGILSFNYIRDRRDLPHAPPLPRILQTLTCRSWPFDYVAMCRARYGDRFTIHPIEMPPLVMLSSPQDIRVITTATPDILHSGDGGTLMEPIFGKSSFTLHENDEHSVGRNAIMPAFLGKAVRGYAEIIADVARVEIASWPVGGAFSLSPYLRKLTLKVMLMTTVSSEEAVYDALCQHMLDMLSVMASPLLQEPRLRCMPGWRKVWKAFLRSRDAVDELIFGLIAARRHGAQDCGSSPDRDRDRKHGGSRASGVDGDDLIDMLLAARNADGSAMSDRQVRDNLVSVIVAGHETTSATLAWAFQLLAHNSAVQDRLIDEIDAGAGPADTGANDFLNATIQETLRHKPTFLFIPPRVVVRPTTIGGFRYRPPARLLGCTYLMHHDPELYPDPDPDAFVPERFLHGLPRPGTWLPWGAGRKRCPGRHLALLEMRTVLHEALSRRLVMPVGPRVERPHWRSTILAPSNGAKVVLRNRLIRGRLGTRAADSI
jgi:cytochrome P450